MQKAPSLLILIDVAEKPKIQRLFWRRGRVLSETAVSNICKFCMFFCNLVAFFYVALFLDLCSV